MGKRWLRSSKIFKGFFVFVLVRAKIVSASSTSSAFDHEPGRVASITSTFVFEPGRVASLTSTFVQILTIFLRFLRFLRSFWTFLGHFGVFLGYFSVFWSIFDQCLPMFVYVRFFGWGSCLTSSSFVFEDL